MKKYFLILIATISLFSLTCCGTASAPENNVESSLAVSEEVAEPEQDMPESETMVEDVVSVNEEIDSSVEYEFETDNHVQEGILLDATLGQAIRKELGYATEEILTYDDLERVTYLAPWHDGITSLTGISLLKNLQELHIGSSTVTDISELSELKEIRFIDISSSYVRVLPDFSECDFLESLYLSGNLIEDISPVVRIPNLRYANLNSNRIRSIEPLKNMETLEMLCIESNCILDYASIEDSESLIAAYNEGAQGSYEQALQLEKQVKEIVASFPETNSELELEKQLYQYIKDHMFYDESLRPAASFGYQGIIEGWGVCGDYAEAFALLANHAGLETYVCSSDTHAWNIIKIDGMYYHCDALWDEDVEPWNHFNKSTEYIYELPDHSFDKERYPDCPITMASYLLKNKKG